MSHLLPQTADFEAVERTILARRATRHFLPDPISPALLDRIVELARWAPSGYNLQPTHFVIVTDSKMKARLYEPFLRQAQVREAPALVILAGDRNAAANHLKPMLAMEQEAGSTSQAYADKVRRIAGLAFGRGPVGLGWAWKASILPIVRMVRPVPVIPAVDPRYWTGKQLMLCAMNLMLAAQAAGLATSPMEGFDETRVRRVLGIPRSFIVPIGIAIGYAADGPGSKTRLPLQSLVHRDRWDLPGRTSGA